MFNRTLLAPPVVCLILLTGCRDAKIRNYRIAKEERPPTPAGMAPAPANASAPPSVHWKKPDAWLEQPAKTMRVGSFLVSTEDGRKADMAITTFPGDVGGDFANINRWRGQIQLPPIVEADLPGAMTQLDLPAGHFQLIDIVSTDPLIDGKFKARILGAWLKQPQRTWFFKLAGESDLVGTQREAFLAFLRSVSFDASTPAAEPSASANMSAMPPLPGVDANAQPMQNSLSWTASAGWTAKPLGQMRRGSFAAGEADVSVTMLAAGANPLLENVNRWRRQIALPALAENELPSQTTELVQGDFKFTVVDYANSGNRVVGAILYHGDEAWFFKLSGAEAAVAAQKAAFIDFLKTVKAR